MKILIFTQFLDVNPENGNLFLYLFFNHMMKSIQSQTFSNYQIHLFLNYQIPFSIINYLEQFDISFLKIHYISNHLEINHLSSIICNSQTEQYCSCILNYYQTLDSTIFELIQKYQSLHNHVISFPQSILYNKEIEHYYINEHFNFNFIIHNNIFLMDSVKESTIINKSINQVGEILI